MLARQRLDFSRGGLMLGPVKSTLGGYGVGLGMGDMMHWRVSRIAIGIVGVLLLGGAVFWAATLVLGGGDPTEQIWEQIEEDNQQPSFRGELGDFLVVEQETSRRPCPGPFDPIYDLSVIQRSELYSDAFGPEPQAGTCPDGTIVGVISYGEDVLSRYYFFGEAQFPSNAPRERLRLLTVAGRPAIAEVPIADALVSSAQLIVIQRFPDGDTPGIALGVVTVNDLDRAISLAEEILLEVS